MTSVETEATDVPPEYQPPPCPSIPQFAISLSLSQISGISYRSLMTSLQTMVTLSSNPLRRVGAVGGVRVAQP